MITLISILLVSALLGVIFGLSASIAGKPSWLILIGLNLLIFALGSLLPIPYYSLTLHAPFLGTSLISLILARRNSNPRKKLKTDSPEEFPLALKNGVVNLKNIKRGLVIFGSAGSGKTESVFVQLLRHAGKHKIPTLCYDYKNGELTEIANHFLAFSGINVKTIVPHEPHLSDRVNPFAPKYIANEMLLRQQTKNIFANLRKNPNSMRDENFFEKIPETTLAAVIWRLKEDYPQFCTLPHAIAICMDRDPIQISEFVDNNPYSRALGTPLRNSLGSEEQLAGVVASLTLPLTDLALPNLFYVLSSDDTNLAVNDPDNPTFLSVVNSPNLSKVNAPIISLLISTAINSMQVRNRPLSMLLFDEGTTFSIDGISQIPATMRSYNIATVFSTQDRALSKENYGDTVTNSLLANLSYQLLGKTNDPESVRYYKQISEEIEKKVKSKSYKSVLLGGDTRYSESTRETSKYKNQHFTTLKPGQFFLFSDGTEKLCNIALTPYERSPLVVKRMLTTNELNEHFKNIFDEASKLV